MYFLVPWTNESLASVICLDNSVKCLGIKTLKLWSRFEEKSQIKSLVGRSVSHWIEMSRADRTHMELEN